MALASSGARGGCGVAVLCGLLVVGVACADTTRAPPAPRDRPYSNDEDALGDAGENAPDDPPPPDDGSGGDQADAGAAPTAAPKRPTGKLLEQMVEQLQQVGADVDSLDRVCAGWSHACAIDVEGVAHCWGANGSGESDVPDMEDAIVQVACGINFSCALDALGVITCWGAGTDPAILDNANQGQSAPPQGTFKQIAIGTGSFHGCAIDDTDHVQCWGGGAVDKPDEAKGNFGQARPPSGLFVRIAAGEAHTCAIDDKGEIQCWGGGENGTCFPPNSYGCGQTNPPPGKFVDITAGEFHSCALRDDGTVSCWGMGTSAEPCAPSSGGVDFDCGQGLVPEDIAAPIARIRAGNLHTCAITEDYEARCWGWNTAGEATPPILYAFSQVVGGERFSCGWTTESTVQCWGKGPTQPPEALSIPP